MVSIFKKSDRVAIAFMGFGVTSYEPDIVVRVSEGKVYAQSSKYQYNANCGTSIPSVNGIGNGFSKLVYKDKVPEEERLRRCKYYGMEP